MPHLMRCVILLAVLVMTDVVEAGNVHRRRVFHDDAGNAIPSEFGVWRIVWIADDPEDQLVGVVGSPTNPLLWRLPPRQTFFDSSQLGASDRPRARSVRVLR